MKKIVLLSILLLISLSSLILNVKPVLYEGEISQGQRLYENIKEGSVDSQVLTLNKADEKVLINYIETNHAEGWRARFFLMLFSFLTFLTTSSLLIIEYLEKKKDHISDSK